VYNLDMALIITLPDWELERPSREKRIQIYLHAYKDLTGKDWPYPVETDDDIRKLVRTIIELERDMKRRGEWPPKRHENKRRRKGRRSRKSSKD